MDRPDPALGMVQATLEGRGCANCGAALTGPYCARCGEHAIDPDSLTVRHFLTHFAAHEVLHLDGKCLGPPRPLGRQDKTTHR